MSSPSMVHRSGDTLVVRSVVSGDPLFINNASEDAEGACEDAASDYADDAPDLDDNKNLPECKIRRNYSCNTCNYFTQNSRHYLYHLRDVHNEKVKIYECSNCLYASKHLQKLLRHTKMVHSSCDDFFAADVGRPKMRKKRKRAPEPPPPAATVATATESEADGTEPLDDEDGASNSASDGKRGAELKCSLCSFTTRHQGQLTRHEKQEHIKTKFFRCSKCSYVTHIKARFTKHVKYHSMPMIKCDLCDFRTPYKWNLDRHYKNHNGRGAFRCSACNFTADIKQSLTVHEMNHHVPPVGQAAGLGAVAARRRNKVGASDTTQHEEPILELSQLPPLLEATDPKPTHSQLSAPPPFLDFAQVTAFDKRASGTAVNPKLKISLKKTKTSNSQEQNERHNFDADFIHPDDIIHHSNGNIYIKNKCKLCNFKSAWETEMARHERKVHKIVSEPSEIATAVTKKAARPVPNLIPIQQSGPAPSTGLLKMSGPRLPTQSDSALFIAASNDIVTDKELNDICAKSANSSLRDFASLFGDAEPAEKVEPSTVERFVDVGDAVNAITSAAKLVDGRDVLQPVANVSPAVANPLFKKKNASFFDKLKAKLLTDAGEIGNLTCKWCGHKSKCLSELAGHQKACGKEQTNTCNTSSPVHNVNSTRCQYCRQRCKSSIDLHNHLQVCPEAIKQHDKRLSPYKCDKPDVTIKLEDDSVRARTPEPHPMENVVFVWNNIPQQMEVDEQHEDHHSVDLSIRVQSPESENSFLDGEAVQGSTPAPQKMPTHGTDLEMVTDGRRVFKCPHCSFWATTASRFHVHIVGHLNKKPFECSLCAYRSNWRWDITKHIRLKSVRDPAHEKARVLMTDETGRRNYSKYNKYLTQMNVSDRASDGGLPGRRSKSYYESSHGKSTSDSAQFSDLPSLTKAPAKNETASFRNNSLRPPPLLKATNKLYFHDFSEQKKRSPSESKKTLFKCKKCNFRHASRESILLHVKGHYRQESGANMSAESDEASLLKNQAPFRCGHCHQVSNWKHVIQRHCRLKHSGDVRVLIGGKDGSLCKIETDDQSDEPMQNDVIQTGIFKCKNCPYSINVQTDFENHMEMHIPKQNSTMKCYFCPFFVVEKYELFDHLKLHGVSNPEDYVNRVMQGRDLSEDSLSFKRYKCIACPYVSNSKSQFLYHRQFHRPRGAPFKCDFCSYNVTKRHLLHQHLRVHGLSISSPKVPSRGGSDRESDAIDSEDIGFDEFEEIITSPSSLNFSCDEQKFTDIPLVWVSRDGKFLKMFKCRFCPHVNTRKVNIQEHEKMHSSRDRTSNSSYNGDEHHCTECNYICNNAGVLSSHVKVHQGFHGRIHCLVDLNKSDEEQIGELTRLLGKDGEFLEVDPFYLSDGNSLDTSKIPTTVNAEDRSKADPKSDDDHLEPVLYFCEHCPARFLNEKEYNIHNRFHGIRLFYRCDYCSYAARQRPHLLAHNKVHTDEYQEKTKLLQNEYHTNKDHLPPRTAVIVVDDPGASRSVWVVIATNDKNISSVDYNENDEGGNDDKGDCESVEVYSCTKCPVKFEKLEMLEYHRTSSHDTNKPHKLQLSGSFPLSGTELFQHKSEAQKQANEEAQNGKLVNGNPKFVYPTYLKNGRMKEKRYKCLKCPSAFEKREQYKVHLSLHGSKQKYKCENCDYSVKYYANYIQHIRKHQVASDTQIAKKVESTANDAYDEDDIILKDLGLQDNIQNSPFSKLAIKTLNTSAKRGPLKLSVADKQTLMILQQRRVSNASSKDAAEDKKLFWCPHCPYTNYRRDAVDNHVNRHICVSGVRSNYTCDHCDYTVPQSHFLREHVKIHFTPQKSHVPESFMICNKMNLFSLKGKGCDEECVIFKDFGIDKDSGDRFEPWPELESDNDAGIVSSVYINPMNGEIVENGVSDKIDTKD